MDMLPMFSMFLLLVLQKHKLPDLLFGVVGFRDYQQSVYYVPGVSK
jgi:hypothetical protein